MFTEWLLEKQRKYVETRLSVMVDLVSNLTISMSSIAGDLEELKVRIEILEKKLSPKKKPKRKKK